MGPSRSVAEINSDFSRKSKFFYPPVHLMPPLKGFHLQLVSALGVKKLRIMGLPGREVWRHLQPSGYNTPTWWTDGHRATAKTALTN